MTTNTTPRPRTTVYCNDCKATIAIRSLKKHTH